MDVKNSENEVKLRCYKGYLNNFQEKPSKFDLTKLFLMTLIDAFKFALYFICLICVPMTNQYHRLDMPGIYHWHSRMLIECSSFS